MRRYDLSALWAMLAVGAVLALPTGCLADTQPVRREATRSPRVARGGGGGGYPARRIGALVSRADWIVRGTVESVDTVDGGVLTVTRDENGFADPVQLARVRAGEQAPTGYPVAVQSVTFRVTATVKGPRVPPGAFLTVEAYESSGPAWMVLEAGQNGLLLLHGDGRLSDLYYPLLPLAPEVPVLPDTLAPLDAIGQYFLLSLRPDGPPAVLEACLQGALDLGIAVQATESLRTLAASADTAVQGVGLWGLVKLKDAAAVPRAVDFMLGNAAVPGLPAVQAYLSGALSQLSDPALATALLPLLSAPEPYLKSIGIDALRLMRSPAAIARLVALVNDPDPDTAWSAAMALGDILHIESTEALAPREEFEQSLQPYRDWWARWWNQEGKAKYGAAAP